MNKKISAVLISALMVLTMFSALVPTASAAETVTPPYEFIGVATTLNTSVGNVTLNANSAENPSIMYYDIDDQNGDESLSVVVETTLEILDGNLEYTSEKWEDDDNWYVSYLGNKYFVVDTGSSEWILSQVLVEEKDDDDHLLRVGETLTLAEGFSITALEIDVEGKKAWLSVSQDGEELKNLVVKEQDLPDVSGEFNYTEDLGASEDTTVVSFIVETVFAGMNTNLIKINTVNLISMATETLESGTDTINDYKITLSDTTIAIKNDEDISLGEDDITDIMDGRFGIRVSEAKENVLGADTYSVGIAKVLTEPGTYELFGVVGFLNDSASAADLTLSANSAENPSIMYYDLDDQQGDENLTVTVNHTTMEILDSDLVYTSVKWEDDDKWYVSYLGNKYFVVDTGSSEWILSQVLVEEKDDDDHLLRVGETLTLAEGFSITALEIDVEGKKAWLSVSQDGEELKNLVVKEQDLPDVSGEFNYTEDLGASEDTTVISFIVETVFAGMNTNLIKINTVNLISMATETLESGTDTINDYKITLDDNSITIKNDEDISLGEDDITDIMDGKFAIRLGETYDDKYGVGTGDVTVVGIVKVITIGSDGPTPTKTATPPETGNVTETGTGTGVQTGTGTIAETSTEVPTEVPTTEEEPGFEAIFAVAGLLAVAYLVLRQRD